MLYCRRTNSLEFTARWSVGYSCWLRTHSSGLENAIYSLHTER